MQTFQVALPVPLRKTFEYLPPSFASPILLEPGLRVIVPFGRRKMCGVIWKCEERTEPPTFTLKLIGEVVDEAPLLSKSYLKLCQWISEYYHAPLGEVLRSALPLSFRQGRKISYLPPFPHTGEGKGEGPLLTLAQQQAVDSVRRAEGFKCFVLEGVTGSGKTEVYLELARHALQQGRQVLVLVPEMSLLPQMLSRFKERLSVPIWEVHSRLTPKEKRERWLLGQQGASGVWVGTRSVVFTPLPRLGLIVVDEEHERAFKQQEGFRYSGRDVAIVRGKFDRIPVVLGSATPSTDALYQVEKKNYVHASLPQRVGQAHLPKLSVIDQRRSPKEILSPILQKELKTHLERGHQALLFVNRRGFAPVLMCARCGWIAGCTACDAHLVIHRHPSQLACHLCGLTKKILIQCASCHSTQLMPVGVGTQQLEQVVTRQFPTTPIIRIDSDSIKRRGNLTQHLSQVERGEPCILVGTQMLAKGHHFPNLTLVAMVDVDAGLFNPDFRAPEHMGQLLTQVAGRAGRGKAPGIVLIQTHHPEHPLLQTLLQKGYSYFARDLLRARQASLLPPYTHSALLQAESREEKRVFEFLKRLKDVALKHSVPSIEILGPVMASIAKKAGWFRGYLTLFSKDRKHLHNMLDNWVQVLEHDPPYRNVRWVVDVDPQEIN
ncbi:MAG: primosomal protein N' [Gammaproteobacteria bacterium]|nr:primosomal protein N' [Gammaproteobacteria bacterium]